mgnify:CR=1 FL=1
MNKQVWQYPLFRHWYDTLGWMMERTEQFPRSVRPTLVRRIDDHALNVIELITEAIFTPAKQRRHKLRAINLTLDQLRILWRLSHDRRYISAQQYAHVSALIDETGKMVGGWLKTL